MRIFKTHTLSILAAAIVFSAGISAQTTAFSYQGNLNLDGTPANGNYDFVFVLFDAVSGGSQISVAAPSNVPVSNGLFSVSLDFGAFFPGASRFMEIRVRPVGGGAFTTLSPRQQFSSAPYAIKSITAENALQLAGVPAATYVQSGATTINAGSQFNISNSRVLATPNVENTFVGINAGAANTTSTGNTFVGNSAGQSNTTGGSNTFVGARAGRLNAGGSNTAVGYDAGGAINSGSGNSIFGANAGDSVTTATNNSIFGVSAGQSIVGGLQNSIFGAFAGFSNISGQNNAFFGFEAGRNNTTNNNSFFGVQSGFATTTGSANSFFGFGSGADNNTGQDNAFFGVNAGRANTIGARNTYLGRLAGRFGTVGNDNVFVGYETGNNTNSSNNTMVGSQAGLANTSGSGNSIFGTAAGSENTIGSDNSFYGVNSGRGNTEGSRNTFVGRISGRFNTIGNENTFIGYNTASASITGNNNTAIGASANITDGLSFATAIGSGASVDTNNTVVIGRTTDSVRVRGSLWTGSSLRIPSATSVYYNAISTPNSGTVCWSEEPSYGFYFGMCGSSIRYKEDVQDLTSGFEIVKRLRPVTFNWKSDGTTDIGLIAEEVNDVEPLLVVRGRDSEIQSVRYSAVGVLLINVAKEQQTQIEDLKKTVSEQQTRIEQLSKLICELKPDAAGCKPE